MTVSAPHWVAQRIFSTSSSMLEATALLPMLALIFTRKLRPMIIGSDSGWLMLAGMMARPAATSSRTNSGVITRGMRCGKRRKTDGVQSELWSPGSAISAGPGCWWRRSLRVRHRLGRTFPFEALILADGDELHFRRDDCPRGRTRAGWGAGRNWRGGCGVSAARPPGEKKQPHPGAWPPPGRDAARKGNRRRWPGPRVPRRTRHRPGRESIPSALRTGLCGRPRRRQGRPTGHCNRTPGQVRWARARRSPMARAPG